MDKKFDKYLRKFHSKITSHTPVEIAKQETMYKSVLAVTYRYLGDIEKSREMFRYFTKGKVCESKFPKDANEKDKTDALRRIEWGGIEANWGVYLDLAGEHEAAGKQFKWAAENCTLSDDEIYSYVSVNIEYFALANLWRGYALLVLGEYDEALKILKTVVTLFNKFKKGGGDMIMYKTMYFLPKLLVPLCEYMLDSTDENRNKAIAGVDEFIGSFKENHEKLDAYVYCLHLMELYPEAYGKNVPEVKKVSDESRIMAAKASGQSIIPEEDEVGRGTIKIIDRNNYYDLVFGDSLEVERYLDRVKIVGDFPALVSLCELYMMDDELEPGPVIEDCLRLLKKPELDDYLKDKTGKILDVAEEARKKGSTIQLFYDENLDYKQYREDVKKLMDEWHRTHRR